MTPSKIFLACFVLVVLGIWFLRYETARDAYIHNEFIPFTQSGETVRFSGTFVQQGRVLVFAPKGADFLYGDIVEVTGILQAPGVFEDFNYADFLAKDGIYAVIYQPTLELKERGVHAGMSKKIMAAILTAKDKARRVLRQHISLPESSVLGAMLLGDKSLLSEETKENLNRAGVRHITAVSGMHVAVLTIYLMPVLIWVGLWRQQAFYVALALMILYVVFTGLQPSAVRAGIMGGMFLLGQHLGRPSVSWRALVFAAGLMLVANPFLLFHDVGFQLSFLAVLGIIMFAPILVSLMPAYPARDLVAMSIAAQVFTIPILISSFGLLSVVSVITNILVVPILPFLMGFGFLFLIVGVFSDTLGFVLSLPVSLMLEYISFVANAFSSLPFAAVYTERTPWFWLTLFYLGVALFWWKFRKHKGFLLQ
jgi:competence protein ComEC